MLKLDDVTVTASGLLLALSGTVPTRGGLDGSDLRATAAGGNLTKILPAFGAYTPPASPYDISLDMLLAGNRLLLRSVDARIGQGRLSASGDLTLVGPDGPDAVSGQVQVTAKGPSPFSLGRLEGIVLPSEPFEVAMRLERSGNTWRTPNLDLTVGQARVTGALTYVPGPRPRIDADLQGDGIDLLDLFGAGATRSARTSARPAASGRLIPASEPPLAFMDQRNGRFRLKGRNVSYPDWASAGKRLISDFDVDATLEGGRLDVQSLRALGDRGEVRARGFVVRSGGKQRMEWTIAAREFKFDLIAPGSGLEQRPAHDIDAKLSATGRTWRQLAASLNGHARIEGGRGRTVNAGLDRTLGSFLDNLYASVNPYSRQERHTQVECSAAPPGGQQRRGARGAGPGHSDRQDRRRGRRHDQPRHRAHQPHLS